MYEGPGHHHVQSRQRLHSGFQRQVLDAGHEHDRDLYAAWVPERMRRDLDRSSIYNRDASPAPATVDRRAGSGEPRTETLRWR